MGAYLPDVLAVMQAKCAEVAAAATVTQWNGQPASIVGLQIGSQICVSFEKAENRKPLHLFLRCPRGVAVGIGVDVGLGVIVAVGVGLGVGVGVAVGGGVAVGCGVGVGGGSPLASGCG